MDEKEFGSVIESFEEALRNAEFSVDEMRILTYLLNAADKNQSDTHRRGFTRFSFLVREVLPDGERQDYARAKDALRRLDSRIVEFNKERHRLICIPMIDKIRGSISFNVYDDVLKALSDFRRGLCTLNIKLGE